ncbi:hypothetical protein ACQ86E_29525 [Bradyrhizobium betae]|uniref:hypothetical protein n=1 Tax=Bradyrhizobium betae TaxID=244734 RepID=UPI003D677B1D
MSLILLILCSLALGAAAFLFVPTRQADAERTVTTEQAAADAGATVLPTDPRLRVEPK